LLLAALLSAAAFPPVSPADEKDKAGKTDKKSTPIMLIFQGKIRSIDLDKQEFVLADAVQSPSETGKKEKKADRASGKKATPAVKSLTFKLTTDARITLDGRTVKFKALVAGHYARVQAMSGRASLDRRDRDLQFVADRKDAVSPVVLLAKRVDASTRPFTPKPDKK